jgi:hypothetical protein
MILDSIKDITKNLVIDKKDELNFTLDAYTTLKTVSPKTVLTAQQVLELFQTKTPQKLAALHICEAMNKQLTDRQLKYSDVKNKSITSLNLPIDTMKFLNSRKQLTPKFKAGQLYDLYKSKVGAVMPYLLLNGTKKRSIENAISNQYRQIDIDFKSIENGKNKALAVFNSIKNDFDFTGISVGGCGVFAFFKVSERCEAANKNQIKAYLEKLFSEKYSFDFDYSFDSIANTQIRGLGYTENVTINKNCEVHDFDFNKIVNVSKDADNNDFVYVDSPLMDFISSSEHLETYLVSKGFSKDRKGRFLAPYQTTSQGSPVYQSDNGTLFLTPFSSSLQDVLGTDKPLHLRQLIMSLEGFETTKEANDFILGFFGIDVTWKKQTSDKNTFLGYDVEHFELSKNQYISDVYKDSLTEQSLLFLGNTGLGKTVLIKSYDNCIVTSFLTTTVNNYSDEGFNVFNGSAINYDISDVFGANKNATTFQSLRTVYDAKKSQFDNVETFYNSFVLVIDEFQQMLTEMYANKAIYNAFEVIKEHVENGGKLRLLTANELIFDFDFLTGLKIKHFVKDTILKPLKIYSYDAKNKLGTAAKFVNDSHGKQQKILALTNRTEKHNDNKELQKLTGSAALNLDSNNKTDFDFRNGLQSSVFTTTALNTGVNIYEKNTDCVIFEYSDFTQISQFFGRLRYNKNENYSTQNNTYSLFRNFDFNEKSFNYKECLELSKRHLKNSVQNAKNEIDFCITSKMTANKNKNGSNVRWNNDLNISEIDYLKINQKNHSYLNTLLQSNKAAFVEMMKIQGYEIEFLEYDFEIENVEVEVIENEFNGFLTALKLTALGSIKTICLDSGMVKKYKNKDFEYWFRYLKLDNETIKNLYFDFKQLNEILDNQKLSFESLFLTDTITKIGKRKTVDSMKLVDSKKTVQRFAFAAAYYESDSLKFQSIVKKLTSNQFTLDSIIDLFLTMNKDYKIKIFKNTDKHTAAGLTASRGVVLELKKYFGNDLVSIVRKTIKASLTGSDVNKTGAILIKVLSNHFKTSVIIENRLKSYCFEIVCKNSDFPKSV